MCSKKLSRNDIKKTKLKLLEMKAKMSEVKIHHIGLMAIHTL